MQFLAIIFIVFMLTGCAGSRTPPMVIDRTRPSPVTYGQHVVQSDETLYSIAWRYGRDFRKLATINGIKSPYLIRPGQIIHLSATKVHPRKKAVVTRKNHVKTRYKSTASRTSKATPQFKVSKWKWPAKGKIIKKFNHNSLKANGIDIKGAEGSPILAAAGGRVVYSGSGLRGLGQLIIIKHSDQFLSAYAHNKKLRSKEGDLVKVGQRIADMGHSGADMTKLHFEIRRNGKPVDPLVYLQRR